MGDKTPVGVPPISTCISRNKYAKPTPQRTQHTDLLKYREPTRVQVDSTTAITLSNLYDCVRLYTEAISVSFNVGVIISFHDIVYDAERQQSSEIVDRHLTKIKPIDRWISEMGPSCFEKFNCSSFFDSYLTSESDFKV